ncbi:MAG: UvrD-helicase domain-containing protein [Nitrospirae bacterium]|nr:UvrD-helicase domain-containing protein [Nitrospirota bacterium]
MNSYLDTQKSVIISSPAGSGKTEKLSRRYISLLLSGVEIEKILCITFTEKAAAEMKERILSILGKENPELFHKIKEQMPLMRISTIHAFCLKLLKRFSIELGIDPSLEITDEFNALLLWLEAVYECLREEREKPSLFFEMIKSRGIKGWNTLYSALKSLYEKRPLSELLLQEQSQLGEEHEQDILELYSKCLSLYKEKKLERHLLDFDDLELLAYNSLLSHPEWQNILYAFDEHTDHILVDEFQDTSSLQWKIIDKLTEEWRSGVGAKRDSGKIPTIFLVGDDKQSIYLFRGANVSVFHEAKERFTEWLGKEYYYEEIKENFRSLPAIVNFTNNLFEKIMPNTIDSHWRTRYIPFEATRQGEGRVELILVETGGNMKKNRNREANLLAKRISSLVGSYSVYDGTEKRPCRYEDMAILLRKRTHLPLFENALRKEYIPFIAVKGIGFYDEPEVAVLRELLSFIIDPLDDYSLFCVLRSPVFGISYETLIDIISEDEQPLIEKIKTNHEQWAVETSRMLNTWIEKALNIPLAILLEEALTETGGWQHYWEKQRLANIKKFIRLIESYESSGFSRLEIRDKLIKARDRDEPKANINTEGMNAVKIMTIHAAKGLQFPMVFLPSLDEGHTIRSSSIVIDEENNKLSIAYEEDSDKRKKIPEFLIRKEKETEEEKRLFYVAVTRARDFLCMLGALEKDKQPKGRLSYITENFDIFKNKEITNTAGLFQIMTEAEVDNLYSVIHPSSFFLHPSKPSVSEIVYTNPLSYEPAVRWRDVTEDIDIRTKHGEDWVLLGRVFHKLFEELSKGILAQDGDSALRDRINERALFLLRNEFVSDEDIPRLSNIIINDFQGLETSGHLKDIIFPRNNAFSEMPFILQKGKTVFKGRVDRIIVEGNIASIYDYKTFPVKDSELPELIEKYKFQMEIYREAVSKILSLKTKNFLLFTHRPLLIEV